MLHFEQTSCTDLLHFLGLGLCLRAFLWRLRLDHPPPPCRLDNILLLRLFVRGLVFMKLLLQAVRKNIGGLPVDIGKNILLRVA